MVMRRLTRVVLTVLIVMAATVGPASAQATPAPPQAVTLYELALRDGSRLYGDVVRQDDVEVVFRTQGGTTLTVARTEILSLLRVNGIMNGEQFEPADPNQTRLFFGPTGRSLKRGQTYLGFYEFALPFVQVGVTDRISIGGGTPLFFGEGESSRPFWLTPKVQLIGTPTTQVAVGVFHGFSGSGDQGGVAYVVGTHGSVASSFTIGAGVGYASGEGGRAPVVMIGGERQFRRNMKVITENYLWRGGQGVVTGGVRFFGERLSADIALAVPVGVDFFFAAPLVNFVYIF
jgi:hypothetical protein